MDQISMPAVFHAELTVSSPAVAEAIISNDCTYPQRDGYAELVFVARLNIKMVGLHPQNDHPSQY